MHTMHTHTLTQTLSLSLSLSTRSGICEDHLDRMRVESCMSKVIVPPTDVLHGKIWRRLFLYLILWCVGSQMLSAQCIDSIVVDSILVEQRPTVAVVNTEEHREPILYQAVKSNILSDLLLLPNISSESYLGNGWSITGSWTHSWWTIDSKHIYWRFYGGDLGVRYHITDTYRSGVEHSGGRSNPLLGHHIGIYGGVYTFDFELGGTGYLGRNWRPYCGLSYGYTYPLSDHWAIELLLGVGYTTGRYDRYIPQGGCYAWQETKRYSYWGPNKAEIALVWLLNLGDKIQRGGNP